MSDPPAPEGSEASSSGEATPAPPSRGRGAGFLATRLRALASAPGAVLRRFPLPAAAAVATMVLLLLALEHDRWTGLEPLDLFPPVALGIPLFLALRLAGERGVWARLAGGLPGAPSGRGLEIALTLVTAVGLAAFLLAWTEWPEPIRALRYGLLFVAAHLLVAVLPFALKGEGFRPFNRHLLLRVLEGGLQALVLLAGISVAFLALDNLFGLRIPGEAYLRLGAILLTGYLPLHVLSGITFAPEREDPRALRVAGRWILVPLSSLYLGILTAYLVQVLALQTWPSGWIGWLVAWMAVVGTLSVLLIRPSDPGEEVWAWRWERLFWVLMVPAAGMFLLALARRIGQYGVTEPRYLGVVLGGWLLVMAALFGLTRVRDLRLLPGTLALVLLLVLAGPWGMTGVSERSQTARLAALVAAPEPRDASEIRAALEYLYRNHPRADLSGALGPAWTETVTLPNGVTLRPADRPGAGRDRYARTTATLWALGLDSPAYGSPSRTTRSGEISLIRAWAGEGPRPRVGQDLPIEGFERAVQILIPTAPEQRSPAWVRVGERAFVVYLVPGGAGEPWIELRGAVVGTEPGADPSRSPAFDPALDPGSPRAPLLARFDLSHFLSHPALPPEFVARESDAWERALEQGPEPLRRAREFGGLDEAAFLLDGEVVPGSPLPSGIRLRLVLDQVTVVRERTLDGPRGESPDRAGASRPDPPRPGAGADPQAGLAPGSGSGSGIEPGSGSGPPGASLTPSVFGNAWLLVSAGGG